jgi:hypothetical protein
LPSTASTRFCKPSFFRQLAEGFRAADLPQHFAAFVGPRFGVDLLGAITSAGCGCTASSSACPTASAFASPTHRRVLHANVQSPLAPRLGRGASALRAVTAPLQRVFNTLATQIDAAIKNAKLANQT